MSKVKNEPKYKNGLLQAIRAQLEHRAFWLYLLCDEAAKRGLDPRDFGSAAVKRCGLSQGADLVKISPNAVPPVCKIMDYGKYRFEQSKREKEAKKNQRVIEIKEIRLSPNIDVHDFDTKVGHARKFLSAGNKTKVSIRFRGREMTHTDLGLTIMAQFAEKCADIASVEKPAKLEGRQMLMFLAPKSAK